MLHAELYALLDLQPQQPPPLSRPERQPAASHSPASHAPTSHVSQPHALAHAEPTKCGQAAQGEDGTARHVRSHQLYADTLSQQFSARPQPCAEAELAERQYGEPSVRTVRPLSTRGTSARCGERRCGTCLATIDSDATIFMAHDRPFCSAACQMCTAARAYSARLVHASLPCPPLLTLVPSPPC